MVQNRQLVRSKGWDAKAELLSGDGHSIQSSPERQRENRVIAKSGVNQWDQAQIE